MTYIRLVLHVRKDGQEEMSILWGWLASSGSGGSGIRHSEVDISDDLLGDKWMNRLFVVLWSGGKRRLEC